MLVCNRKSSIETKFMLGMDESCLYVIASVAYRQHSC